MRKIRTSADGSREMAQRLADMRKTQVEALRAIDTLTQRNQELEAELCLDGLTETQCEIEASRQKSLAHVEQCNYESMCAWDVSQNFCSNTLPQPLGEQAYTAVTKLAELAWRKAQAAHHYALYCKARLAMGDYEDDKAACIQFLEDNLDKLQECLHPAEFARVRFALSTSWGDGNGAATP